MNAGAVNLRPWRGSTILTSWVQEEGRWRPRSNLWGTCNVGGILLGSPCHAAPSRNGPGDEVRVGLDDLEISEGRLVRLAAMLLPITQRTNRNLESLRELRLR